MSPAMMPVIVSASHMRCDALVRGSEKREREILQVLASLTIIRHAEQRCCSVRANEEEYKLRPAHLPEGHVTPRETDVLERGESQPDA